MGCIAGAELITRGFYVPFYQNKVTYKREKQITLTYQLFEAIISTEASIEKKNNNDNKIKIKEEEIIRCYF